MRQVVNTFVVVVYVLGSLADSSAIAGDYEHDVKPILKRKCFACHGALKQEGNLRLDTVRSMSVGGDSGPAVEPAKLDESSLWERVTAEEDTWRMPPEGEPLSETELEHLREWIAAGIPAPANEQPQTDPREHWAFQPLKNVTPPASLTASHPIDAFVRMRLDEHGLAPNAPADAVSLVRRLSLDLHGLPPSPDDVSRWADLVRTDAGRMQLINELLASPRYGERMAQFWLDLVRYADTHGFEVNTPRPHAWPYRDYVIESFNADKPYDRFIVEQLAGDSVGADVATGFLVAAPVLLPGQIGKDDASKRLARQDSLDEIIVGTGATFLGLTIGCARCHDHKFDPISQQDYYSFQAFFSGVRYGDRPIVDEEFRARQAQAHELALRIEALEDRLEKAKPRAFMGKTLLIDDEDQARTMSLKTKNGHGTNSPGTERGHRSDPGDAGRLPNLSSGRYTWWDNVPGEDVFTWNPGVSGEFRLWISWGTHGSGVHTRDARYVLDFDGDLNTKEDQREIAQADQYYFAGQAAGESARQPLWSGLLNTGVHTFSKASRLILRGGETGTGITADVIVLQEPGEPTESDALPRLRASVSPTSNIEMFPTVEAKFVRFTVHATSENNRYEPCLDELEVFSADASENNVAANSAGTVATSSGNYASTGRHQLSQINDGHYGNDKSWISNERGGGWVQLEFAHIERINKVIWSRDRVGKYQDRLPVNYDVSVSTDGEHWMPVAGSHDRFPSHVPVDQAVELARLAAQNHLPELTSDLEKLKRLEQRKRELETPRLVYAGTFHEPEPTFLLSRGDPEQPLERVAPAPPSIIGDFQLPDDSQETDRRRKLARWIASPENPLTARVMVNRIWQMHFGRGLVNTPSDFGLNGSPPSHPELLDWLAAEFIRSDWSIKHLHRLMLTSATYGQSSLIRKQAQQVDADNRLLWRFPSRRVEAEAIRDSMLQVSGELNLEMGGPGFDFFASRGGLSGFPPKEEFGSHEMRRMIYAHKIRMESIPVFGAFDCPDAGQPAPTRPRSTTAIQALNLFNSPFVYDRARAIAERIEHQVGDEPIEQIIATFRLMLGRSPSPAELAAAKLTVEEYSLVTLSRVLLNSNEFLFLP